MNSTFDLIKFLDDDCLLEELDYIEDFANLLLRNRIISEQMLVEYFELCSDEKNDLRTIVY